MENTEYGATSAMSRINKASSDSDDGACRSRNSHKPIQDSAASAMPLSRRLCYSVGHVLNDITASVWFTYLLVYLHAILKFDAILAGYLMLLGQVVDAISTPLIGYESDRTAGLCDLGRRKSWYLVGTVCVATSFLFIYNPCVDGANHPSGVLFVYYIPFIAVSQFGWAAVQISHLSLIPELTSVPEERVQLNSLRYGFSVLSNILVFGIAWFLLTSKVGPIYKGMEDSFATLNPSDATRFRYLMIIVTAIGLLFAAIFFFGTKEKPYQETRLVIDNTESTNRKMEWTLWLKEPQFYQVGILYMCARLYVNISQIYLPMYIIFTGHLSKGYLATVPLVVYASGFVASLLVCHVNALVGLKVTYLIGGTVGAAACTCIYFIRGGSHFIYVVACTMGFGGSTMLVTALSLMATLIGSDSETGAFVYGSLSFSDKLSSGIAIIVIQHLSPNTTVLCDGCSGFFKLILAYVPGAALLVALVALLSLWTQDIGTRKEHGEIPRDRSTKNNNSSEGDSGTVSEADITVHNQRASDVLPSTTK